MARRVYGMPGCPTPPPVGMPPYLCVRVRGHDSAHRADLMSGPVEWPNTPSECVFCRIVMRQNEPATVLDETWHTLTIVPLNPVTEGHVLVVPAIHVSDAAEKPEITAIVMEDAARYGKQHYPSFNLITSVGQSATQTVFHLHVHVVPREPRDGLMLPWDAG